MEKLQEKAQLSFAMKQVVLWVLLFAGLIIASFVSMGQPASIMIVAQNVLVFIAPAILFAYLAYQAPWRFLRLDKAPALKDILLVIAVMVASLPAMNYLVEMNKLMHLPQWMSGVEEWMRESEDAALEVTNSLLSTTSFVEMLWIVLIVGVLTGIAEEMFFRGAMLGTFLQKAVNKHVSIIFVAFIFSAFHLQFFGFFPRLLLGIWFGYLVVWTRSLWVPIIAHALNNSLVVVATYLANTQAIETNGIDSLGLPQEGQFPIMATASVIATAVIIYIFAKSRKA
ncbi:MAG: CPBP family intramembrane metalloprotease [Muribaculaceae bacterium]|nr:CPBP family intramembrane metalloprotease [Muribaculaceae bacterium]